MNQSNRFNWFFAGFLLVGVTLLFTLTRFPVLAQQSEPDMVDLTQRIEQLEQEVASLKNSSDSNLQQRVNNLEGNINGLAPSGLVIFLYAGFCALWAQTKRQNAVLWFIFGGIFNVFALILLLYFNWRDQEPEIE